MKNSTIRLIVLFSALALVGIIVTQTFWIKKAIEITRKNYEHRAYSALGATMFEMRRDYYKFPAKKKFCANINNDSIIIEIMQPVVFDSVLRKYIGFSHLESNYEFAIAKSKNDSIIFATKHFDKYVKTETVFRHTLSMFYRDESYHVKLIFPGFQKTLISNVWGWLILSFSFLLVIIFCFCFIIFAVYRQKRLSEMKTDFINNMTHEFKTPISTITLASEVLVNSNKDTAIEKIHRYSKIIYDENLRMRSQVDKVLQMAQYDRKNFEISKELLDIHELIQQSVNNFCLEDNNNAADVVLDLKAKNYNIYADSMHMVNIIKNLVDNAFKYSPKDPKIEVSTYDKDGHLVIVVKDNGIGISEKYQKYVFDRFYRVPTGDVHDVQGSGIGLYYVKTMVEAHSGTINLESEPGVGSKFEVVLPIK
jgi:two-component system phosphate regulon sensor histidine kinase PhoR